MKIKEKDIKFTQVNGETWISAGGWEGPLFSQGCHYEIPEPTGFYTMRRARRIGEIAFKEGLVLTEVEPSVFKLKTDAEEAVDEESIAFEAGIAWMATHIKIKLGHSLEELAEHAPEIRRIFGDADPQ